MATYPVNPRDAYNTALAGLNQQFALGYGSGKTYEQQVDQYVQQFAPMGISAQEIGDTLYNMYSGYYGAPRAKYYGGAQTQAEDFTPTATGGTDTSQLQTAISNLEAQRQAAIAQFEPLYAKYLQELETNLGTAKEDYRKQYLSNAELNDARYGEGLQNIQRGYGARGLGDSSYKETALQGLQGDFSRIYGDLTSQYQKGVADVEKQAGEKKSAAEAMKYNLYNPNNPQFTDVSQVASYAGQLGSQLESAKTQLSNARLSNTATASNPAASDKMFQEYAQYQVEQGTPWGQVAGTLQQRGQTDPSYDAYLSYLYGSKEGDSYKYLNPQKIKYLY